MQQRRLISSSRDLIALLGLASLLTAASARAASPLVGLNLRTPDGGEVVPLGLGARVLIVDLWATWCAPCAKAVLFDRAGRVHKSAGFPVSLPPIGELRTR